MKFLSRTMDWKRGTLAEIAINFLKMGFDIKTIASCTGLSIEQIETSKKRY